MKPLDTTTAQQIIERAELQAKKLGVNACIAIVDSGAHLKAFLRMDGAPPGPVDVSQRKARTSSLFQYDSGDFGKIIESHSLIGMDLSNGGLAAFPGGMPILAEGEVIGAIGISGGSADQDRSIACYALQLECQ